MGAHPPSFARAKSVLQSLNPFRNIFAPGRCRNCILDANGIREWMNAEITGGSERRDEDIDFVWSFLFRSS